MSEDDCIFCKIAKGEIPCNKIYEDDTVLAFLDIQPVSDGHTLVIPKSHFGKLDVCPEEIVSKVVGCVRKIAFAVAGAMEADGYNILCNNGRAAGQLVDHAHFHVIPRKRDDGVFAHWPAYKYEQGQAEVIAEKICEKL